MRARPAAMASRRIIASLPCRWSLSPARFLLRFRRLHCNLGAKRVGDEAFFVRFMVETGERLLVRRFAREVDPRPEHDPRDRDAPPLVLAHRAPRLIAIGGDVEPGV